MISRLLCLLVLWPTALFAAAAKVHFEQNARTIDLFGFIEITVRVPEASARNPFLDTSLTGTVVLPSDETANVDGFCDAQDGSVFRLRFMPMATGRRRGLIRLRHSP